MNCSGCMQPLEELRIVLCQECRLDWFWQRANLNLNRRGRDRDRDRERVNRGKGLAAAAAKIATRIDVDDLHSWWSWWWTSEARQKCSKKTVCFAGEPKGQNDVVVAVLEAVVVITLDVVAAVVVVVIRLICKSKGHAGRCPLKLHRTRKAQRSRATKARLADEPRLLFASESDREWFAVSGVSAPAAKVNVSVNVHLNKTRRPFRLNSN